MRKALRFSLLILIFMSMAGIGAYVALTLIIKGEESVVVPQLTGKDVLYGLEILSDLGLNTRVKGRAYHDQVPKNHVIDQDPDAGTTIKRGRDVKIRVSSGPETVVMPNLTGLSLQQSRILLTQNGLCRGALATVSSSRNTMGQVMAQVPLPGATVSRQTCTDLLVSQGPSSLAFPMTDLTGLPLETAIRRLEQLQLTVGSIRMVHMAGEAPETIVEQRPLSGYRMTRGTRVDLSVNRTRTYSDSADRPIAGGVELYRFSIENGFLNKRVQVKLNTGQVSLSLFDEFVAPGQEIWLLIPKNGNPTVLVYVDGQLVETRFMNGR